MTTLQFVADMTSDAPTVLLDLNVSPFNLAKGFDFSAAGFEKGWATNPMRHGGMLSRSVAGIRQLQIPLQVVSPNAAGFSGAVETLGRILMNNGILRVQFSNSSRPVFFRTFADPDYATSVRGILSCAVQYQLITLTVFTDPFAYGPRVEVTGSPFTVANDPALSNGFIFDIANVQGDVPTPLLIVATSTAVTGSPSGLATKWTHVSTRSRGIPSGYSNLIQAESMTLGTNAAVVVDSAMSGGNKVTVTPGTATMALRLSDSFPGNGVSTVEARGLYRVYARVVKSIFTDTWNLQLGYGASSTNPTFNDKQSTPIPSPGNNGPWMVDLGYLPVPAGADPITHGYSGSQMKVQVPFIGLYAERLSGTGTLQIDYLYFVPADESTLIVKWPADLQVYAIDGTTDSGGACYATVAALDEVIATNGFPQITSGGGFPELVPGSQVNRVHFVRNVDLTGVVIDPTNSNNTTIRAYYWPRWRNLVRTP